MIFKIAFNVVGIIVFISIFYLQWKMLSMAVKIRGRNAHLIGKGWNGRASMRQYKKLAIVTEDEDSKRLIRDFSNYTKMQVVILFAGISLFLLIGFLNSRMNG